MGYDVLERLKNALKTKADRLILEKLSSEFYQVYAYLHQKHAVTSAVEFTIC